MLSTLLLSCAWLQGGVQRDDFQPGSAGGVVRATQRLEPELGAENGDRFGTVATLGDLDGDGVVDLAVGASGPDNGRGQSGHVWILFMNSDGTARVRRRIGEGEGGFTGDLGPGDSFGSSLAALGDLDGDGTTELVVGEPLQGAANRGRAWILFLRHDGSVRETRALGPGLGGLGPEVGGVFGVSLAGLGDWNGDGTPDLAVGATNADAFGAVFLLMLAPDGTVRSYQKIGQSFGGDGGVVLQPFVSFGAAVAVVGDLDADGGRDLAIGDLESPNGAIWVLRLRADHSFRAATKLHGFSFSSSSLIGSSLSAAGDMDGDGVPDLLIGDPNYAAEAIDQGAFWTALMGATGSIKSAVLVSESSGGFTDALEARDHFGQSLAGLGDLDGDGLLDLAVGATLDDIDGCTNRGNLWVCFLRSDHRVRAHVSLAPRCGGVQAFDGFARSAARIAPSEGARPLRLAVGSPGRGQVLCAELGPSGGLAPEATLDGPRSFGAATAGLGDLDGDGSPDLAVGAPDDPGHLEGTVRVVHLDSHSAPLVALDLGRGRGGFTAPLADGDRFGCALAALDDLDGNGVPDLAVGASGDDALGTEAGAVWILFLEADGSVRDGRRFDVPGLAPGERFGSALAALPDLDHDGVGELAVGAPGADSGLFQDAGRAYLLFLGPLGVRRASRVIDRDQGGFDGRLAAGDRFGAALAYIGDLDADGVGELVVGAPGADGEGRGAAWVLALDRSGRVRGQREIGALRGGFTDALAARDGFGLGLAGLGDLDLDGVPDLFVGAPGSDRVLPGAGVGWWLRLRGRARIDFETIDDRLTPLVDGQDLSRPPRFGRVLEITGSGANLGPAIFDSTLDGPNETSQDRDLLVGLGNVLILQNSLDPSQSVPGIFDHPNDDQDGGRIELHFLRPTTPLSIDLVDVDRDDLPGGGAHVRLVDDMGRARDYTIPPGWTEDVLLDGPPGWRTLDLTTLSPQPGFQAPALGAEATGYQPTRVVQISISLFGTTAIDNLGFEN